MKKLLVIGGSDAGISAALRAREVNPSWNVRLVVADRFPNFSICGLPFYLSGETPRWENLAHRTREEIEGHGVELLLEATAELIDPASHRVRVRESGGRSSEFSYDRLVVGTGARPARPPIGGLDARNVYMLHTMADSFAVHEHLADRGPKSAIIIGAGYIGLEMADALRHRGLEVTVCDVASTALPTVDAELGRMVQTELDRNGVRLRLGAPIEGIERSGERLVVVDEEQRSAEADMVLVATGVRPEAELARRCGIAQVLGSYGAEVSKRIDVFATALFHRMRVADLLHLDLSYTPPLSSPWDPVQSSCMDWARLVDQGPLPES